MPVFAREEYVARLNKVRSKMADVGLDILIVSDPCNINYLSGYDAWSFYTMQSLIVTLSDEEPVLIGRQQDVYGARLTAFMDHARIVPYPDILVQNPPHHPVHFLADHLDGQGLGSARIGVELGNYYYGARTHLELGHRLPNARLIDAELLVNWIRVVKSEAEIDCMRQAGRIVEKAMTAAIDAIQVGVRQCDVAAIIYHAQISGTAEFGGTYTTTPPLMPSGERVSAPHLSWTDQPFAANSSTNIEIAGCRHRYHAPLSRTVYLGDPHEKYRRFADGLVEGLGRTLDAVRPGITCGELCDLWRGTVAPYGIEKESRIGYSTGIGYPPTWGDHTASIRPGDRTVLEEGMTFHLMPGIWDADIGLVITESFVVTARGHETLSALSRHLVVKP